MVNFVISDEKKKNRKKIRKKNRDGVVMLLSCLHGLCAFPNMVSDVNTVRKSGRKEKKRTDMMQTVVDNVGVLFTWSVHISKYGKQCKYSQKIRKRREKKNRHDIDCYGQCWGSVYMVCAHFQIW